MGPKETQKSQSDAGERRRKLCVWGGEREPNIKTAGDEGHSSARERRN